MAKPKLKTLSRKLYSRISHKNNGKGKGNCKGNLMKGGRYLGEGSFGCVVAPALSCNELRRNSITRKAQRSKKSAIVRHDIDMNNKTVSKIVLSPDDDIKDEIDIALELKKIDPSQQYFITLNEYCRIRQIPSDRSNITRVRYTDDSGTYYQKLEKKPLDKKFCPVDLSMRPINLVMPYGGIDLMELAQLIDKYGININSGKKTQALDDTKKQKIKTARMMFANLRECIKNLLMGLLKMHRHRIVNRDIKEENIMANYDETSNKVLVRYIDFGLSDKLTPEFCRHYSNISRKGTFVLIAPEIFITYFMNKYYGNTDEYIMNKINNDINLYVRKMLKDLKLDTQGLTDIVKTIYNTTKLLFQQRTILPKYFGTDNDPLNGYLQKNDVYSLGIALYEFLAIYTNVIDVHKDLRLYDLLKNMLELNPEKRYNVLQCLNHPYFKE
jgi:serine/threonine protein kinase